MTSRALADTGPLVAIVRTREKAHKQCAAALKAFRPPLLTCWPVLTEAAWLLRQEPGGFKALGRMLDSGLIRLAPLDETAVPWIIAFLDRYASAKPDLTDAALMYLAEREGIDTVFTLDRRDFSISFAARGPSRSGDGGIAAPDQVENHQHPGDSPTRLVILSTRSLTTGCSRGCGEKVLTENNDQARRISSRRRGVPAGYGRGGRPGSDPAATP